MNTGQFLTGVRYRLRCRYLGWMTRQQGETRLGTTTEVVVLNRGERSSSRYVICAMSWTVSQLRGKWTHFVDGFVILLAKASRNPDA